MTDENKNIGREDLEDYSASIEEPSLKERLSANEEPLHLFYDVVRDVLLAQKYPIGKQERAQIDMWQIDLQGSEYSHLIKYKVN